MTVDAPSRDAALDNARALLIALVVVGHLLQSVPGASANVVVQWIYSFHMAAFVAVTGHLARSYAATPRQVGRLVTTLAVPYLLFQAIHAALDTVALGRPFRLDMITPSWTLWFLVALLTWRLLTPVLRVLRRPLLTAVLLSFLVPLDDALGPELSAARAVGMLPFYVAGLMVTREQLAHLRARVPRWLGAAVLVVGLVASWVLDDQVRASMFFMNTSYAERHDGVVVALVVRALALAAGLVGTIAVLALVPDRVRWFTRWGRYSLYVYLLHPLVLYPVRYTRLGEGWDSPVHTLVLTCAGTVLTGVLASRLVVRAASWVVEPPLAARLVKPDARTPQRIASSRKPG